MIEDALNGKIDLIITKSISCFARNTVDTLTPMCKLKKAQVEAFFEEEQIYKSDSKGEFILTLLSSMAQEESHSLSENVKWGKRKHMADGKYSLPYKQFIGYKKDADGKPEVLEDEAVMIQRIYKMYLECRTPSNIAAVLTGENIPSPAGCPKWSSKTIISILKNEKYWGAALLQKTFTADFLTKKKLVFDPSTWRVMIDRTVITRDRKMTMHFIDGSKYEYIIPQYSPIQKKNALN